MKSLFRIAMLSMLLWTSACVEPVSEQANPAGGIASIDGRLVFPNDQSFFTKLAELKKMPYSDVQHWSNQFGFTTLEYALNNSIDGDGDLPPDLREYADYSPAHKFVINSDGLVQVGDNVVLYKGGIKYQMKVDEFNALSNKSEIMKSATKGYYRIDKVSRDKSESGRFFDAWLDGNIDQGGDQYEYNLSDGSHRKFVSEFYVNTESMTQLFNCGDDYNAVIDLYLRMKLEGRTKSSRPWSLAPDPRDLEWNVTISDLVIDVKRACTAEPDTYPVTGNAVSGSLYNTTNPSYSVLLVSTTQEVEFDAFASEYNYRFRGTVTGTDWQYHHGASSHTVDFSL